MEMKQDAAYVYLVHGVVPEFMPHFAFRREKHFGTAGRKIIKCPHCRNVFTTVDADERVELYQHSKKAEVSYHASMPCHTCRKIVGIVYAGA
jgi:uncharacterized protein with PIN domain